VATKKNVTFKLESEIIVIEAMGSSPWISRNLRNDDAIFIHWRISPQPPSTDFIGIHILMQLSICNFFLMFCASEMKSWGSWNVHFLSISFTMYSIATQREHLDTKKVSSFNGIFDL
jgi:hypothetical protein